MEKLKDLLHDLTDVLMAIGIVVVMFAVVTINLGDWFNYGDALAFADSALNRTVAPIEDINESANRKEVEDPEEKVEDENNGNKIEDKPTGEPTNKPTEDTIPKEPKEEKTVVTVVEIKKITIPSGSPGVKIAKILQENQLLSDPAEFIKVAEDLKLALKLKSGTFEIPSNATIEEMVKIIAK